MGHPRSANYAGAFADDHKNAGGHFRNLFDRSVWPANFQAGSGSGAEPEMQPPVVDRKVRRLRQHGLHLLASPYVATTCAPIALRLDCNAHQQDLQPVACPAQIVAQQRRRLVEIHDQNIDIAVIIEIAECDSA